MTRNHFFQYITSAAIACCIVALTLITVRLAGEFIELAIDSAGGISRLIP